MFKELLKAAVGTALLPVGVVVDVVKGPAIMSDEAESTTVKIAEAIVKSLEDAMDSEEE